MTAEQFGIYVRLLIRQWIEGSIPADHDMLAALIRVPSERLSERFSNVIAKFEQHPDNPARLINARLADERDKATAKVEKNRLAGRKGGSTKANAKADAKANAKANDVANGSIRASDSASDSNTLSSDVARANAIAALERVVGYQVTSSNEYQLQQYVGRLPDPVRIHGKDYSPWELTARALSSAAEHADCKTPNQAIKYIRPVCERCIRDECWPGEFDAKGKPKPRETVTLMGWEN